MDPKYFNTEYLSLLSLKSYKEKGKLIYNEENDSYRVPVSVFNVIKLPVSIKTYTIDAETLSNIINKLNTTFNPVDLDSDTKSRYEGLEIDYIMKKDTFFPIGTLSDFTVYTFNEITVIEASFKPADTYKALFKSILENPNELSRFGLVGVGTVYSNSDDFRITNITRFQLLHDLDISGLEVSPAVEKIMSETYL